MGAGNLDLLYNTKASRYNDYIMHNHNSTKETVQEIIYQNMHNRT